MNTIEVQGGNYNFQDVVINGVSTKCLVPVTPPKPKFLLPTVWHTAIFYEIMSTPISVWYDPTARSYIVSNVNEKRPWTLDKKDKYFATNMTEKEVLEFLEKNHAVRT